MTEKYKNKYRIQSARLQHWDYGWNASYFVTICTHNHEHYFGGIVDDEMVLSDIGKIAWRFWGEIPNHFPFVILNAYVVMPNHLHGIIIIDKTDDGRNDGNNMDSVTVETQNTQTPVDMQNVETQNFASLQQPVDQPQNKFGPQSQNLASIIRGYKTGVKKYATMNNINFTWQPRFHDHIIRNNKSYITIQEYIINNPAKWNDDTYYEK